VVPLLLGVSSGLRNAALVLGGVALGVAVAVGGSVLLGGEEPERSALGRPAAAEGSPPLLDPARLAQVQGPRTRADTPAAAVEAFLSAERAADHEASFGYLADSVRLDYGSPAAWAADHPDVLPPVTGFTVEQAPAPDSGNAVVTTLTRYRSSLDAVTGLVPARARTTWTTVREDGGWAVDAAATTQVPLLPADGEAATAVQSWAQRLQRCAAPQGEVGGLRGRADLAAQLCRAPGEVRAGAVSALAQVDAAPLQTSFGADVVSWARTVALEGPVPLRAVVAPVDDGWTVVGVLAPSGGSR
jgi:hypothetical protein